MGSSAHRPPPQGRARPGTANARRTRFPAAPGPALRDAARRLRLRSDRRGPAGRRVAGGAAAPRDRPDPQGRRDAGGASGGSRAQPRGPHVVACGSRDVQHPRRVPRARPRAAFARAPARPRPSAPRRRRPAGPGHGFTERIHHAGIGARGRAGGVEPGRRLSGRGARPGHRPRVGRAGPPGGVRSHRSRALREHDRARVGPPRVDPGPAGSRGRGAPRRRTFARGPRRGRRGPDRATGGCGGGARLATGPGCAADARG